MHKRRLVTALSLMLFASSGLQAENWMCGQDLNGNGNVADPGETNSCSLIDGQRFCPIAVDCSENTDRNCSIQRTELGSFSLYQGGGYNAINGAYVTIRHELDFFNNTQTSHWSDHNGRSITSSQSIDNNAVLTRAKCQNNHEMTVNVSAALTYTNPSTIPAAPPHYNVSQYPSCSNGMRMIVTYDPRGLPFTPGLGWNFIESTLTFTAHKEQKVCDDQTTYSCPLGNEYACLNNNGRQQCSQNTCVDLDSNPPVITDEVDGGMLVDDGQRDSEGLCMDQLMIYSGRAMTCDQSGTQTAFQNCCDKGSDQVLTDDMGPIVNLASSAKAIKTTYSIAQLSYYSYQAHIAGGATIAEASAGAAAAAQNGVMLAVDPATLAMSLAVQFVISYLTKACDQQSMETSMMAGSGYCHYIGEYCTEEWDFIGCVQESESYCCFNSKMARIIHEQGRPQLNSFGANSWGDVESPNCRGFNPDEFQSLDFSKIDLSEYYNDLTTQTEAVLQQKINKGVGDFYEKTQ